MSISVLSVRDKAEEKMNKFLQGLDKVIPNPSLLTIGRLPINEVVRKLSKDSRGKLAVTLFGINTLGDWLDGASARANDKTTKEGAALDPFTDKLINIPHFVDIIMDKETNIVLKINSALAIALDVVSTLMRGNIVEQLDGFLKTIITPEYGNNDEDNTSKANVYGKLKLMFQSLAIIAKLYDKDSKRSQDIQKALLLISNLMSVISLTKKVRQQINTDV